MPPTKDDPLGGDGQDGGEGGLFAKSPPLSPVPPLPFKNSYQGEPQGTAATAGLPLPDGLPAGSAANGIFSARWRACHVKHACIRPQQLPFGHSLSSILPCCRETGGRGTVCETGRPTILPAKLFAGWMGAGGEETASKRKTVRDARFLLFAMLPGDWRTRDGLRDQTAYDTPGKVFCGMDGGRGGKRQHQKEKQYEMPAFFFLPCCRETGGQGTACETRRPTILPEKFFAGWMGGAGGRKGAFLQKSPLPSPRIPPAPF